MPGTALRRVYQQWHLCRAESSWKEPSTAACSCLGTTACLQALCKVLCLCWKPGILKIGCLNPVLFVLACWIVIATANQDLFLLHPGLCKAPVLLWSFMWKKTLSQESAKGVCLKLWFWLPLPVRVRLHVLFPWCCWYKILPFAASLVVLMVLVL